MPKEYLVSKRLICKNWYVILTSTFTKKILNILNEPCHICYSKYFAGNFNGIAKINDKLYCYNYYDKYIDIINKKGKLIDKYEVDECIDYITGYGKIMVYHKNNEITISDSNGKRNIKCHNYKILDMATDGKHIYILSVNEITKYDINGEHIKKWTINNFFGDEIIVNKDEIYVSGSCNECIHVYSNDGELIRKIYHYESLLYFDISGNYIYAICVDSNMIKIFTKEGKMIYCVKHNHENLDKVFVIDDIMCIVKNNNVEIYKIIFY